MCFSKNASAYAPSKEVTFREGRRMRTRASARRASPPPRSRSMTKPGAPDRLRALARRCRVVSEETALPEISQELVHIAEALEDEADTLAGR